MLSILLSQAEIFNIIRELGGHATKDNIRQRAKEKYPQLILHKYVYDRLESPVSYIW
jgi:hypothetical protein